RGPRPHDHLGREALRRRRGGRVYADGSGTRPDRRTGVVVLRRQAPVPDGPDFYLPALAARSQRLATVLFPGYRDRRASCALAASPADRVRSAGRRGLLRRHARAGPWLL